jgi:hypothetical protein
VLRRDKRGQNYAIPLPLTRRIDSRSGGRRRQTRVGQRRALLRGGGSRHPVAVHVALAVAPAERLFASL